MTQPYMPYYTNPHQPAPDLSRPARYAGLMMIILGTLTLVMGGCVGFAGQLLQNSSQTTPELQAKFAQIESQLHVPISTVMLVAGIIVALPGIIMMILSVFVRRGGLVSAVLGIVVTGLVILYLAINVVGSIVMAAMNSPGQGMVQLCMAVVPLALFSLQLYWLVKAAFNAGPLRVFNQYQQAWQWQAQQQYQQYHQQWPPPPAPGTMPPPPGQGPLPPPPG